MINRAMASTIIGTGCFLLSSISFAAGEGMDKDEWLGKLKNAVPAVICKSFVENDGVNKQMKANNIDYDKCVSLIPASFDKCKGQDYSNIPAKMDKESAEKWGSALGECIGTDFALTNFTAAAPDADKSAPSADATSSTPAADSATSNLTKDKWLSDLRGVVPELVCKGFMADESLNKQLTKVNINYDKCVTLIPESFDKCQKEYYADIPSNIDDNTASQWGHKIGECIGKDFAVKYLL